MHCFKAKPSLKEAPDPDFIGNADAINEDAKINDDMAMKHIQKMPDLEYEPVRNCKRKRRPNGHRMNRFRKPVTKHFDDRKRHYSLEKNERMKARRKTAVLEEKLKNKHVKNENLKFRLQTERASKKAAESDLNWLFHCDDIDG